MPTFWANTLMDRNEVRERMQRLGRGPHGQRTNPTPPQHQHPKGFVIMSGQRSCVVLFEFETPLLHPFLAYLRSAARCQREVPTPLQPLIQIILRLGPGLVENRARSADPFALLPPKTHTRGGRSPPPVGIFARNDVPIWKNNAAITQKHVVFAQHDPNVHNSIKNTDFVRNPKL